MRTVRPLARLTYGLIDIVFFTAMTLFFAKLLGWAPRFDFMQAYSQNDREQYWNMLLLAFVLVSLASLFSHAVYGKSIGKSLVGARSVRPDGSALGLGGALARLGYIFVVAALAFLPGPLIAFTLGPGSESISVLLLLSAFVAVPVLSVVPWHEDGSPLLQHYFGVRTIYDREP